jgi:hypothetical protein
LAFPFGSSPSTVRSYFRGHPAVPGSPTVTAFQKSAIVVQNGFVACQWPHDRSTLRFNHKVKGDDPAGVWRSPGFGRRVGVLQVPAFDEQAPGLPAEIVRNTLELHERGPEWRDEDTDDVVDLGMVGKVSRYLNNVVAGDHLDLIEVIERQPVLTAWSVLRVVPSRRQCFSIPASAKPISRKAAFSELS